MSKTRRIFAKPSLSSPNLEQIFFSSQPYKNTMNSLPRLSSLHCHLPYSIPIRVNRNVSIIRCLHASASKAAVAHPVTTHGPPPKTPLPAASQYGEYVERKKRQSELVKQGKELRKQENPSSVLKKRFWKDVHVKEVSGARASFIYILHSTRSAEAN